ncbi:AAA family ATPase [Mycobacterium sp. MYCO198283]|uniref:AAA family ATPase n=1 Tax=Mycobacterium sp. MYCO198283 TaxID=2883505 RepID=UPI001E3B7FE4|nr:AAA family ATPase [Mycobacterium sp. MYCO198283]MCG5433054.1 AAA family ATPase [Mycobacterium sp. MYCO198283]
MTSPTDQRRAFDAAVERYKAGDTAGALAGFRAITAAQPSMSDAWLGRLACGDTGLDVIAAAHENSRSLYRETRRIGLVDGDLHARVDAPMYVTLPVWSRATVALGYAAALIREQRFPAAAAVLADPVVTADPMAAQWCQFLTAALYHLSHRWPDVLSATATSPPAHATHVIDDLTAAVNTLGASAAATLGQFQTGLDRAERVRTANQYIAADAALTRGWCLRELGQEDAARAAFEQATANGVLLDAAREALANPGYRLVVTDEETIASRTDPWDRSTETSREARAAADLASQQEAVLAAAQTKLDELIGLSGPKEQITVWRTEIQIDQILAARGEETSTTNENHMVLEGPPGTAKTSFARIAAEFLFGLGKIERPDVLEVTEEDLVVGYISQTAARMREVCEQALGGVLFIDEAYRLAPEQEGHSFGKDAINTLLKYMEDFRDRFVVIVAGYPKEMRRFMQANPGLASRFHLTLTFSSYTPDEIVQIGQLIARKEKIAITDAAWPLLRAEAARLRDTPLEHGTALDTAGNGRFARKVVIHCKHERARRLSTMPPHLLAQAPAEDLLINADDMRRAIGAALAQN